MAQVDWKQHDRQYTYNVTLRHVRLTTVAVEKQQVLTYTVCVFVALGIQHGMFMRHIFMFSPLAVQYFATRFHKRHYFRQK